MTRNSRRHPIRRGRRLPLTALAASGLIVASLTLTGCLGGGGSQVGAGTGQTNHQTAGSLTVPPDSPATTVASHADAGTTSVPSETRPTSPGTFGTISPPVTTVPPRPSTTRRVPRTAPPTTTPPPPAPPGSPVIAAVTPSSGRPGQVVTLTGTGLFSSNGLITVLFGGVAAGVSCSTTTACQATVPNRPTPGPVPVTITTTGGTSRPVTFTYV